MSNSAVTMGDRHTIRVTCPSCQKRLLAPATLAGKRVRCPDKSCSGEIEVFHQPIVPTRVAPVRRTLRRWVRLGVGVTSAAVIISIAFGLGVSVGPPDRQQPNTRPGPATQATVQQQASKTATAPIGGPQSAGEPVKLVPTPQPAPDMRQLKTAASKQKEIDPAQDRGRATLAYWSKIKEILDEQAVGPNATVQQKISAGRSVAYRIDRLSARDVDPEAIEVGERIIRLCNRLIAYMADYGEPENAIIAGLRDGLSNNPTRAIDEGAAITRQLEETKAAASRARRQLEGKYGFDLSQFRL